MAGGRRVQDYEYDLPENLVARYPPEQRDASRLLVVARNGGPISDRPFREFPSLLARGDVLVVNDSKVLPVRLKGRKPTGAPAEILLLRPAGGVEQGAGDSLVWEALVRPGGKLKPGRTVTVGLDLDVEILDSCEGGGRVVRLVTELAFQDVLTRYGHVPLPPYLEREDEPLDRERYQTVYAEVPGSVAAPTAGLHFTTELLAEIDAMEVERVSVTLDVGVGTFRPVEVDDPGQHAMHSERYCVPEATARAVVNAKREGRRVWAVGTTVVRALESAVGKSGVVEPRVGTTELFIRPPYEFRVVDALVTNFHLPRSTLIMLVAAFGGYESTMNAYDEAIRLGFGFYSYGDSMAVT
ncbi:MAG: tRNA preQ1(34) S-adenosylmethionine ribosyltransferase-isomerase QueA [Gemmatimonadota bacterium]|nr:MAG: tRNA preQ1(34) S-adenosylmethionine ribosyltransferase-isomerase QueA [Gemmatimonadota bacterium]